MAIFQVSSRSMEYPAPPRKRVRRFPTQWYAVARVVGSGFIEGTLFTLLTILPGRKTVFILLPVLVSLTWAQPKRYNINNFLTSTLAFAIILEPVRVYIQRRIELCFNLQEREKAIEAFTATLREEIDLEQLRKRLLTVIQKTMKPYSISF